MDNPTPGVDPNKQLFNQPNQITGQPVNSAPQNPKNETLKVLGINLLIYGVYFALGLSIPSLIGLVWFGYMLHSLVLLVLSIIRKAGKGQNAGAFAFTGLVMLFIGFGGCTAAFSNGLIK